MLDGERGLISYFEKKNIMQEQIELKSKLVSKIDDLEFKNSLLTNNLDLDYIEILLRKKFLLGKRDEKFYIIEKNDN